jgi:hypothetical protein
MNWTVENLETNHCVKVVTEGVFTTEEQDRMLDEIISKEYWKPDINVFFDCRKCDFSNTDQEMPLEASMNFIRHDALIGCGKVALLMKSVADFTLGREFEILTDEKVCANVGIFLNETQVFRWLDL